MTLLVKSWHGSEWDFETRKKIFFLKKIQKSRNFQISNSLKKDSIVPHRLNKETNVIGMRNSGLNVLVLYLRATHFVHFIPLRRTLFMSHFKSVSILDLHMITTRQVPACAFCAFVSAFHKSAYANTFYRYVFEVLKKNSKKEFH